MSPSSSASRRASRVLQKEFFSRPVLEVAPDLLGKFLIRHYKGRHTALIIEEVEAYDGPSDKACHAHRGKSERNAVMFGPAGRWYVYFCYGVHWMLNIVTGPVGYPAAVLIRGVKRSKGGRGSKGIDELNGPGKITKALHIDKRLTNKRSDRASGLWIEDRGVQLHTFTIRKAPRIGVAYAGEWAKKPYRFTLLPSPLRSTATSR